MANRVIRDWTTSEKIDSLSELGELFFVRLIMRADDHGCFHANPKLLKAALFPLKDYSEGQMSLCLRELSGAGIIQVYESEGRQYLKINDFGQRLRNMVSKFPQPADNPLTIDGNQPPEKKRNEVEEETKPKLNEPDFVEFKKWSDSIIDGNDFIFTQKFQNEFPSWGGGAEKFVEVVNDHFDMLNRYPKMNPNSQERFRNSVIKHFREYKGKQNGTGTKKGLDVNAELQLIANHIKGGQR